MSAKYSTLMAQLAAERRWTYEDGVKEFARTAAGPELGLRLTVSVTQWRRWLGGQGAIPRPANARVLERVFGRPIEELFSSPVAVVSSTAGETSNGSPASLVEEAVMDSAHSCAQFLARIDQSNVGPLTIEQFQSDVRRLASQYPNRPVFPSFVDITELRDQAFGLLEGRQPPNQTKDLYYVTGQLCAMLAMASLDLGWAAAAETQARTAWLCADLAGSNWLRAWVRGMQARIAYWDDRPIDAARLAEAGREYVPDRGTGHVQLGVVEARALGKLHDSRGVDAALGRAEAAREAITAPDDPAGLFSFTEARQLYYSATARVWLGDDYRRAADDATRAIAMYLTDPPADRRVGELALARLDLAAAQLGMGELDGACHQMREVMAIASRRRTYAIGRRLRHLAALLAARGYADTSLAIETREEIAAFTSVALAPALPPAAAQ